MAEKNIENENQNDKILKCDISQELRECYIDYAMSVIVSRAIPDCRDGLKPVQRRILYSMKELGIGPTVKFKKCALIVGHAMGRYHPHGDMAIYDTLVRMAQPFSLRYTLVHGQGNFGCFTGDTKIKLADGRNLSFLDLIKEQKQGIKHWGFAFNTEEKKVVITEILKPRMTRENQELVEITLDNDEKIKCTLNHKFMVRNGTYIEAQDLKEGDSLMPLYIDKYVGSDKNLKEYEINQYAIETLNTPVNHKVKKVEFLKEFQDVYDITTTPWHNFALASGIFVHNSVDGDPAAASRYCITKDSLILTDKGMVEIGSISDEKETTINMNIATFQGKHTKASKFFDSGKHPTITVKNQIGYEITGSYNHPILCLEKNIEQKPTLVWKTLETIKEGDYTVISRNSNLFSKTDCNLTKYFPIDNDKRDSILFPKAMTKDLAFILGAIVAEGSFHQGKILFINKDEEYYDRVKELLNKVFPGIKLYERTLAKCQSREITIYQKQLVQFFVNIGLTNVKSDKKEIPFTILQSTKEVIAEFLRSLYEGDGSTSFKKDKRHSGNSIIITYVTKSAKLAKQVRTILLNFGITTNDCLVDKRNSCFCFTITSQDNCNIFEKNIGFYSYKKKGVLANVKTMHSSRMSKNDFVPFLNDYLRANYPQSFIKKHNLDRYNKLQANYWTIKSLLKRNDQILIENILQYNFLFSPVKSVVKNKIPENVYSIRVDSECHSFVANGFVNHNTECRMMSIADEMFNDIEKETIDLVPNYDNSLKEPKVLPTKVPQLLLNGTTGIAVGMATNIPPHHLGECMDAAMFLADNPDCNTDDLMQFVKGPDFPTGGTIYGWNEIREAYATGKGKVLIRGTAEMVESDKTRQIVITEIPYMVNKSELIKKIANLIEEKKIINIRDIRDESDKSGMTITIDLKKEANPKSILNQLYKYTDLEKYFHVNAIALIDDGLQPELLSLKDILREFLDFRKVVIFRRTQFLLRKAKERLHILEGLKTALDHIDEIIEIIKKSESKEDANLKLCKAFKFTEIQANVILETKLQAIAKLEKIKILNELKEKLDAIAEYEGIIKDQKRIVKIMKQEFAEIKEKYNDVRRTKVVKGMPDKIEETDLIPEEDVLITLSQNGYIKRMSANIFRTQQRGGKGITAYNGGDNDLLEHILTINTKDNLLFFSDKGKVYQTGAYDINDASREAKGKAIQNFIDISGDEKVTVVLGHNKEIAKNKKYLIMATQNGVIKKTELTEFQNIRKNGLLSIKLDKDDLLKWADFSSGDDLVCLVTKQGQSITFSEKDVRSMGRSSSGVTGIKLAKDDKIVGMMVLNKASSKTSSAIVSISQLGYGKKTLLKEYRLQKRGGTGIKTFKITPKTGLLVTSKLADSQEVLIAISNKGLILQTELSAIPCLSRTTQGVKIMRIDEGDGVSEIVLF